MLTLIAIVAAAVAVAIVANWKFHFFKLDLLDEIKAKQEPSATPVKVTEETKVVQVEPVAAKVEEPKVEVKTEAAPQRAKDSKGKFVKDDPTTPENEAWVGGVAPPKKAPAPKNTSGRKPATKKPGPKK